MLNSIWFFWRPEQAARYEELRVHALVRAALRSLRLVACGVSLAWCSLATPSRADDAARAAARRLATAGVEAFQRDDYPVAVDKLERAYQMLQAPSIGLWLARALVKQGRLIEAQERYTDVGRLSPAGGDMAVQESAKNEAAVELEALAPTIPSIIVRLEGAKAGEARLTLDGKALPAAVVGEQQPVDPGKHRVEGMLGEQVVSVVVDVAISENEPVTLRFAEQPSVALAAAPNASPMAADVSPPAAHVSPQSGSTQKILAWSALGSGAAGIIVGAVAGSLALSKKGELDDSGDCVENVCLRSTMQDELDSYATLGTVSSVGFIAGGTLAAVGVVLLVTSPRRDVTAGASAWVRVGPRGVMAEGRF